MAIPFFFRLFCLRIAHRDGTAPPDCACNSCCCSVHTMLLGVESVCISTGPPAIQMQLLQHVTVSPRLSGMLFRGLLSQCSVSMSPIAFEGQETQRGYVQLHVHTIFIPVRARSCHSLTDSYPSIHTSWSRMTRKKIPKPKARKLTDIHTPQSIDRTLRWGTICSPGCVDESSP